MRENFTKLLQVFPVCLAYGDTTIEGKVVIFEPLSI